MNLVKRQTFYNEKGEPISFKVSDIEQLVPQQTSIMPDGLEQTMTNQEFRDLIAYLMQQR